MYGNNADNVQLDPYVNIDINDEYHVGTSKTQPKTNDPKFNEDFAYERRQCCPLM